MAKKSKKVEKETRRLIESIAEHIKKKGDRYKFKSKSKKIRKQVAKTCPHWTIRKGKEQPTVIQDPDHPGNWKCTICQESFPIRPQPVEDYYAAAYQMLAFVNQMQFYSVKLGGDADDTRMFLRLKQTLPRFAKVSKNIIKRIDQRQKWEDNKQRSDALSQFSAYSGFNYKA